MNLNSIAIETKLQIGEEVFEVIVNDGVTDIVTEGVQGPRGIVGPTPYEKAVSNGFTGTESEWLALIASPDFTVMIPDPLAYYILAKN